jgi:hypothetical protein
LRIPKAAAIKINRKNQSLKSLLNPINRHNKDIPCRAVFRADENRLAFRLSAWLPGSRIRNIPKPREFWRRSAPDFEIHDHSPGI